MGNPSAIPSGSGCVNLEKRGMLDLDGNSVMIGALSGSGGVTNSASGTSTLTVGAGDQTSQFSGEIDDGSGSVALLKVAGGTLTLTGDNSYSGGTTIDGGTLDVPGPQDLPYSDAGDGVSVASGATLEVGVTVGGPDAGNTWASSLDALLANPDFTGGNLELDLMSADADVMPSLADITSGIPFTFSTDMLGDRSLIVTGNSFLQLTGSGRYHGGLTLEDGATLLDSRGAERRTEPRRRRRPHLGRGHLGPQRGQSHSQHAGPAGRADHGQPRRYAHGLQLQRRRGPGRRQPGRRHLDQDRHRRRQHGDAQRDRQLHGSDNRLRRRLAAWTRRVSARRSTPAPARWSTPEASCSTTAGAPPR